MNHGRVQLQVLEYLHRDAEFARAAGIDVPFVPLTDIAGVSASQARIDSVIRAVRSLASRGLIELRDNSLPRSSADRDASARVGRAPVWAARLPNQRG